MITLQPNRTYRIVYAEGRTYKHGGALTFETLDHVPEAKHLVKVRNLETGEIVNLIDLLAHPWHSLEEDLEASATKTDHKKNSPLQSILLLFFTRNSLSIRRFLQSA